MRQHTSDDHLVDEHAPRVAIAVVIDVGYLRIAFQLGIPQLPPVCEGKTVPHVQPYSCMYVCTTLVWLSMGDARVFLYVRCLFELLPIILPMQGTTARKVHAECVRWLMDSSRWGAQPKKPYLRGNGCLYIFNGFVIHLATDHSHSCERVAVLG